MEYNVAQLLKAPIGTLCSFTVHAHLGEIPGLQRDCRVEGEVRLLRALQSILATGTLHTSFQGECSRCLEAFEQPLVVPFEAEFFPTVDVFTGRPLPSPAEPEAFTIDEHHILSLCDLFRQEALLALPLQPLCDPDCKGLCPQCGQNRNDHPCSCDLSVTASPFAVLQKQ